MTIKEKKSKQRPKVIKEKSRRQLIKEADSLFSVYIRTRDKFTCYTCGKVGELKTMQNGHYISRSYLSLRYNEENCHCQCVGCNVYKKGNYTEYARRLIRDYGVEILDKLEEMKLGKLTTPEIKEIIKKYRT